MFYGSRSTGTRQSWLAAALPPAQVSLVCPAEELQTHSRNLPTPWLHTPHFILLDLNSVSITAALKVIQLSRTPEWQRLLIFYTNKRHLHRYVLQQLQKYNRKHVLKQLDPTASSTVLVLCSLARHHLRSPFASPPAFARRFPPPPRGAPSPGPAAPSVRTGRARQRPSGGLAAPREKHLQERAKRSLAARKKCEEQPCEWRGQTRRRGESRRGRKTEFAFSYCRIASQWIVPPVCHTTHEVFRYLLPIW